MIREAGVMNGGGGFVVHFRKPLVYRLANSGRQIPTVLIRK